jgi:glycolate oxidase iron-sulfur subunit
MQTDLPQALLDTPSGKRADEILRACVHCGFCNATCPTYQLLGDELDGPRGRIYLIKDMLETGTGHATVETHLDRCLTCRACETTCPSGVAYGELLEIGRDTLARERRRPVLQRLMRFALVQVVSRPGVFRVLARLGHWVRWLLPERLRGLLPVVAGKAGDVARVVDAQRNVVVLEGCVQRVSTPASNAALRRLLADNDFGVIEVRGEQCCGGLALHLGQTETALQSMRRNIAALVDAGDNDATILSTASGCGVTVKDYGRLLGDDVRWGREASRVAQRTLDAAEFVDREQLRLRRDPRFTRVAWQAPCTLQHGQGIDGTVERLLQKAGYQLLSVADSHLCCGSAGSYAALQPELSQALRARKLDALLALEPDVIATANVGCQMHLGAATGVPVLHWLELVAGINEG